MYGRSPVRINGQFYRTGVLNITIELAMPVTRGHDGRYPVQWGIMDNPSREDLACDGYEV
jgi:hypothetical protein